MATLVDVERRRIWGERDVSKLSRLFGCLLGLCLAALALSVSAQELDLPSDAPDEQEALRSAKASMVRVSVIAFHGDQPDLAGWGSGFVIAPGYVVTNFHVVEDAEAGRAILMVTPAASTEGEPVAGRIVHFSRSADLALLRVDRLTAPAMVIATGQPDETKPVRALGYPAATCMMVGCTGRDFFEPSDPNSTEGSIAQFQNRAPNGVPLPTIFHTAAISMGNSGGPLIDRCGRVLGVNTWTAGGQVTDAEGHVFVPGGQNVASRASTLVAFLREAGVAASSSADECMTAAEVRAIEAQRRAEAAEEAIRKLEADREAQARAEAEAMAKAEADRRLWLTLGAVALLVGSGAAGLYLIWRRRGRDPSPGASEPAPDRVTNSSSLVDVPGRTNLFFIVGLGIAALAGGAGLFWLLTSPKPSAPPAKSEPMVGLLRMDCTPDLQSSFGAQPPTAVSFVFDTRLQCVNGRTAYASSGDAYERYIVHRDSPTVTRNRITRDLTTFTQEEFAITRDQWRRWTDAMERPPECPTSETGVGAVETRLGATASLRANLPPMPVGKAIRRCVPAK